MEAAMPFMQKRHNLGGLDKLLRTLGRKGLKLYLAAAILNAIVQITMVYFISSYVTLIGGSALQSAVALSALFFGTMAGRLVYAQMLCCKPARKVLPVVNALALAAFAAMLLSTSPVLVIALAGLGGVGLSMNFPAYLVELCNLVPDDTAAASALVFLGYTLACFAAPPVFGAIGDAIGLQTSLLIGTAVLIPLIVVSMRLHSEPQSA